MGIRKAIKRAVSRIRTGRKSRTFGKALLKAVEIMGSKQRAQSKPIIEGMKRLDVSFPEHSALASQARRALTGNRALCERWSRINDFIYNRLPKWLPLRKQAAAMVYVELQMTGLLKPEHVAKLGLSESDAGALDALIKNRQ